MKKHICFVIGNYNSSGGTERVTSQIANGLSEKGYEISILSIGQGEQPYFNTNKEVHLIEMNELKKNPWEEGTQRRIINKICYRVWCNERNRIIQEQMADVLEKVKPDVVVAVDIICYRYIEYCRRKVGFKSIGWEHFSLDARNGLGVNYSRYLAIKNASRVIVLSNRDLEAYQRKYPKAQNIQRIYNPNTYAVTRNVNINNKVVVAAGRYVAEKGFDLLIESWSKIKNMIPDWELRIFGEGEDRGKLQALIDDNKVQGVKLCGYARNLDVEFNEASIFALSSRHEGWGLVLIEAQAKGLPCISFDVKHGPAEIIDDGVNGYLVPPYNTDEFAEKLLVLMQNSELRNRFSINSQKDLYKFELSKIIDEWVEMLERI